MKKWMLWMILLTLCLCLPALAEDMIVVNCDEWVSLRAMPDTSSSRLVRIPLGAVVTDCEYAGEFIECTYQGERGYVLGKYLAATVNASGRMVVANCDSWVSLRSAPSTSADRLIAIPLGEQVYNCERVSDKFIRCDYNGWTGYVLAEYLEPAGNAVEYGDIVMEELLNGYLVRAVRSDGGDGEILYVSCWNANGDPVWSYETRVPYRTELDGTYAFIGGTESWPLVMVHNVEYGLYALDVYTGAEIWMLSEGYISLGAGNCSAVDENGTMYIGGYYGPDPVAIDINGNVLWQGKPGMEAYWLYQIDVTHEGIIATYSCLIEHEKPGQICYSAADGSVLWSRWM